MINPNDVISLVRAAEQIKPPATFLSDLFFPTVEQNPTPWIMMEYRKRGREKLAPYVVEGSKGVTVTREGSQLSAYKPPLIAPRRDITQRDITQRAFGEEPYYSTVSVEERQAKLQADDLADLIGMIQNRKNQMAAEILTRGKVTVEGYADDGELKRLDEIRFETNGDQTIMVGWDNANAKIFEDLQSMSETIQESSGIVPTVLVVGKNVAGYLFKNKDIRDWMMIPNRQTGAFVSFEPRYITPNVQFIGQITALNLEVYCYNETYTADDGSLQPYLGANEIIMGVPGRGTCQHAAVTLIDDAETGFRAYAAPYVPSYTVSKAANSMSLTVWSRFILIPNYACDFMHATVAQ